MDFFYNGIVKKPTLMGRPASANVIVGLSVRKLRNALYYYYGWGCEIKCAFYFILFKKKKVFGFDAFDFWSCTGKLLFLELKISVSFPTHMLCFFIHHYSPISIYLSLVGVQIPKTSCGPPLLNLWLGFVVPNLFH